MAGTHNITGHIESKNTSGIIAQNPYEYKFSDPSYDPCLSNDWEELLFNCHSLMNIQDKAPLEFAMPIYGFAVPGIVIITLITNTFVILVLSRPALRTPTNVILMAMAIAEMFTGFTTLPWFLYYYTFDGYNHVNEFGLPEFWCKYIGLFTEVLPTMAHTSAIWLTVFLAVQRYVQVVRVRSSSSGGPSSGSLGVAQTTLHRLTRAWIIIICLIAVAVELPKYMSGYSVGRSIPHSTGTLGHNVSYDICLHYYTDWALHVVGLDNLFSVHYWFVLICVHALPCLTLALFTGLLLRYVRKVDQKRRKNLFGGGESRMSQACVSTNMVSEYSAANIFRRISINPSSMSRTRSSRFAGLKTSSYLPSTSQISDLFTRRCSKKSSGSSQMLSPTDILSNNEAVRDIPLLQVHEASTHCNEKEECTDGSEHNHLKLQRNTGTNETKSDEITGTRDIIDSNNNDNDGNNNNNNHTTNINNTCSTQNCETVTINTINDISTNRLVEDNEINIDNIADENVTPKPLNGSHSVIEKVKRSSLSVYPLGKTDSKERLRKKDSVGSYCSLRGNFHFSSPLSAFLNKQGPNYQKRNSVGGAENFKTGAISSITTRRNRNNPEFKAETNERYGSLLTVDSVTDCNNFSVLHNGKPHKTRFGPRKWSKFLKRTRKKKRYFNGPLSQRSIDSNIEFPISFTRDRSASKFLAADMASQIQGGPDDRPLLTPKQTQPKTHKRRSYQSTTKMLLVVIALFLAVEVPAAIIFGIHIYMAVTGVGSEDVYYRLNVALIFRNVSILASYPFNFAIYCGMSQQFRSTVSKLYQNFKSDFLPSVCCKPVCVENSGTGRDDRSRSIFSQFGGQNNTPYLQNQQPEGPRTAPVTVTKAETHTFNDSQKSSLRQKPYLQVRNSRVGFKVSATSENQPLSQTELLNDIAKVHIPSDHKPTSNLDTMLNGNVPNNKLTGENEVLPIEANNNIKSCTAETDSSKETNDNSVPQLMSEMDTVDNDDSKQEDSMMTVSMISEQYPSILEPMDLLESRTESYTCSQSGAEETVL